MGWFSWLFGPRDPDAVAANGRALLAQRRFNDARLSLEAHADHPACRAALADALVGLVGLNLETAARYAAAGAEQAATDHFALADDFREQARAAGADLSTLDRLRRDARRAAEDDAAALRAARAAAAPPPDPAAAPPDEADAIAARVGLLAEGYPDALRSRFPALGAAFVEAVFALEDGEVDRAAAALDALPDDEPLVWWERSRAAAARRDPAAAAHAARRFAELAGGHHPIAGGHSGVWLAARLAEVGDTAEALAVLRSVRAGATGAGGFLYAQLLEQTGALPEAEATLVALVRQHPNEMALYELLGRVRAAAGKRVEAMRALEAALHQCACGTGSCGAPTPGLGILRQLATLYLEDGADPGRGRALAEQARAMVRRPVWEDVYLAALAARGTPEGADLAARLREATPDADPRAARVAAHLSAA